MSNVELTKDADKLICVLYHEYLNSRSTGISKETARYFGSSEDIQRRFFVGQSEDDITRECWGLHTKGILNCSRGDDLANNVYLTNDGIKYMESRFPRGVQEVIKYLSSIFGIVRGAYGFLS